MVLAVVLVSDQTVPNAVYLKNLKEFGGGFDRVLFISTERMEKNNKSQIIAKAVGINEYDPIIVNENMLFSVKSKLENYFANNSFERVRVNITGGTKIMSLGAYQFFFGKNFVEDIVYLPIGSNAYKQIYPMGNDGKAVDISIRYKMNVREYLDAIGAEVDKIKEPVDVKLSNEMFDKFFNGYEEIINELTHILRNFRKHQRHKKFYSQSNEEIVKDRERIYQLLGRLGLDYNNYDFKKRDWVDFFSGGWLEEYVYDVVSELKNEGVVDDVIINVKFKRKSEDAEFPNEFDVVAIKDNNLYVFECKSGNVGRELTDVFYKVAYLNREMGLAARSFLVYLGDDIYKDGKINSKVEARKKVFGVGLIDRKAVENSLKDNLKKIWK